MTAADVYPAELIPSRLLKFLGGAIIAPTAIVEVPDRAVPEWAVVDLQDLSMVVRRNTGGSYEQDSYHQAAALLEGLALGISFAGHHAMSVDIAIGRGANILSNS